MANSNSGEDLGQSPEIRGDEKILHTRGGRIYAEMITCNQSAQPRTRWVTRTLFDCTIVYHLQW
jgi:hypothetical protein